MSAEPFVREARADIDRLSDGLVELERSGDRATVDELFRRAHGLKGNLRMEGYDGAADLAHTLEDALDAVRAGVDPDGELVDRALAATDTLDAMVDEIDRTGRPSTDPDPAAAALAAAVDDRSEGIDVESGDSATDPADGTDSDRSDDPLADAVEADDESVAAALDAASEFDDLDALVEEMDDDDGAFETLEGGGSFDDLLDDEDDGPAESETDDTPVEETEERPVADRETVLGEPDDGAGDAPTSPAETPSGSAPEKDDPSTEELPSREEDPFTWVKASVDEETPVSELQAEVEAESFGEFDDEDDMSIQELIELDPDDRVDATDDAGADEETATQPSDPFAAGRGAAPSDPFAAGSDERADGEADPTAPSGDEGATDAAESGPGAEPATTADAGETDAADGDSDGDGAPMDALHEVYDALSDDEREDDHEGDGPAEDVEADPDRSGTDLVRGGRSGTADAPTERESDATTADSEETAEASGRTDTDSAAADAPTADPSESGDVDLSDVTVGDPDAGTESFDAGRAEMDAFESRFEALFAGEAEASRATDAAPTIEASALPTDAFRPSDGRAGAATETTRTQSLTVDAESAEQLLSVAERLSMQARELRETVEAPAARDTVEALTDSLDRLQRTVMEVRLLPLSTVTDGLARVVRDAARETDTRAELTVEGEDVALDRSIVDRVGDPIRHLVRNAVDHGIEPPAEREAAGKPPTGTVEVLARREGDRAVVEVRDDGRGIDPEAVREAAVAADVVDPEAARDLTASECYDLLFRPGLSTAEAVTATSGRGVGMDVVEQTVTGLGGDVTVESRRGEGTTVRLRLPVSVVVTEVLFVEAGGQRFAVPVEDVTRVGPAGGAAVVDGGLLATGAARTVELASAMATAEPAGDRPTGEPDGAATGDAAEDAPVVTVDAGAESVAVRCDRVGERHEAVITPYDDLLVDVPGVSGATTDAGGRVVHVLDVTEL